MGFTVDTERSTESCEPMNFDAANYSGKLIFSDIGSECCNVLATTEQKIAACKSDKDPEACLKKVGQEIGLEVVAKCGQESKVMISVTVTKKQQTESIEQHVMADLLV